MVNIHSANAGDINSMFEVDLRGYDYPLGYSELKTLLACIDTFCVIAADEKTNVIGYAIFKKDSAAGTLEIIRLAVLPKHRRKGTGSKLLLAGRDYGITANVYEMHVWVPEILCNPGDADDQSAWLSASGFVATVPLKPAMFVMYGQTVPGIKFTRKIDVT